MNPKQTFTVLPNKEQALSPWCKLVTHTITAPRFAGPQEFHALKPADYVTILAVTADGRIPLVRQYRPILERVTLELPGGLLDPGEDPEQTAVRELEEETGFVINGPVHFLGQLTPDTGRLENRMWAFFAASAVAPNESWQPSAEVEPVTLTKAELRAAIEKGEFDHALHIGLIGLAMMRGLFAF
ncbi:MAG: NUDIX hydrolase [Verrucomicrobia bacterium]|nr:NUDIX hydrolase [Verrucomicrobiota bacterium]